MREEILAAVQVRPITVGVAQSAGEALAHRALVRKGPSVVDAIVVAFAAMHGGVVYTGDVGDLSLLRDACFPGVRVLAI